MRLIKASAIILAIAMTAGSCACNKKNASAEIETLVVEYASSLRNSDFDGILGMTSWDEDDKDYKNVQETFAFVDNGSKMYSYEAYILSTIKVNYESEDIEIDGKEASLKFEYELVDWQAVYSDPSEDEADVLSKLKKSGDTITVSGKLDFELVDGEWKISKISGLDKLFEYADVYPYIATTPDPVFPDPVETDFDSYFTAAVKSYIELLETDSIKSGIKIIEENYYGMESCGLYDLDKDGVPELYFLMGADDPSYCGTLYIYDYNEYAGEAVCVVEVSNVIYQAGDGGAFLIYTIPEGFVIQTATGGETKWNVYTDVYDYNWNIVEDYHYMEEVIFEGDNYDDVRMEYEYYLGGQPIQEGNYSNAMLTLIASANVVIANRYYINESSAEAPLLELPLVGLQSYEATLDELNSMK